MTKYVEKIFDSATGEETIRPYTVEEVAQVEAAQKQLADKAALLAETQAAKDADKAALLAKLGITADEAKLLLA